MKPAEFPPAVTSPSFLQQYFSYVGETEAPMFYHRWAILSSIGAYLGRQFYTSILPGSAYPNIYSMIIGAPGTRKSTAIKLAKRVLTDAGYDTISADKCSKEKFLMDLAGMDGEGEGSNTKFGKNLDSLLDENIFGDIGSQEPREMFIACDEFNDFIGPGNMEFISLLGNLWDYSGTYNYRTKGGKPVVIPDPTVSILGGNTTTGFAQAFPPATMGQGFMSRLLLIYGEPTGIKIPFPKMPSEEEKANVVRALQEIKLRVRGEAVIGDESRTLLAKIYNQFNPLEDARFISYSSRRFTHLIKLCLIISASYYSCEILPEHVVEANTLLAHTEHFMPKALGQFGLAKNSEVAHAVVTALEASEFPLSVGELYAKISQDVPDINSLFNILNNLSIADRLVHHQGKYALKTKRKLQIRTDCFDYSYLTQQEREM